MLLRSPLGRGNPIASAIVAAYAEGEHRLGDWNSHQRSPCVTEVCREGEHLPSGSPNLYRGCAATFLPEGFIGNFQKHFTFAPAGLIHDEKMPAAPESQRKWTDRNFVTEILLPSFFQRKSGVKASSPPIFPKLKDGQICITWIGHASFLIQTEKVNLLVDPNWANWMMVIRRLRHAGMALHHLPNIDLVLITHAHFDHLDRRSLRKIASRQTILVPSGVGNLVHDLGFERVHEMNWWDTTKLKGIDITFTPAKHWGARKVVDRHRGYGGYMLQLGSRRVYNCGDSSYFDGFKEIGKRFAPDISLMPIGAYNTPSCKDHHMSPEQALTAFHELKSKVFIPMHYGSYRLSYEPMHEPPQRLMKAAAKDGCLDKVKFLMEGMPQVF